MTDEWGPWIEHDGKGCPCVGMFVHRVFDKRGFNRVTREVGLEAIGVIPPGPLESWHWKPGVGRVIRYRIRKPRALIQLIDMVENLPAPTERVEA